MRIDLTRIWPQRAAVGCAEERLEADAAPLASEPRDQPARTVDLAVWIVWNGDAATLESAMAPICALERHRLTTLMPVNRSCGLWRCCFRFEGRLADQEARVLALLSRIAAEARWLRVERFDNGASAA